MSGKVFECCAGVRGGGTIREANARETNGPRGRGEEAKGAGEGTLFVDVGVDVYLCLLVVEWP